MAHYEVKGLTREETDGLFYVYDVFRDGKKVAQFGHSHRGDEPMLKLPGGEWEAFEDILVDDEPAPYSVSLRGSDLLDVRLNQDRR
jgi:hypothetical protein